MNAKSKSYKNWSLHEDENKILWLELNGANEEVNVLSFAVLQELESIVADIQVDPSCYSGIVIISGKKPDFIAGADVKEIAAVSDMNEAVTHIRKIQTLFSQIEALPIPVVAAINGFCLGGGTELALACHYRLASDERHTQIGLPEVKIGIHPGFGGSVRSVRLLGVFHGMNFILEGRSLDALQAKKLGLVDDVMPLRELRRAAIYYIQHKPKVKKGSWINKVTDIPFVRNLLGALFKKKLAAKIKSEQYPAPYAVIDNWINVGSLEEKAFATEAESVGKLLSTPTCRNLLRVFFLQGKLKTSGKETDFKVRHIHIIGSGVMGGDIAAWCAVHGLRVTLQDPSLKALGSAVSRTYELAKKRLKQKHLIQAAVDRLCPDPNGDGIAYADLILEAAVEKLDLKHEIFKQIEARARADAIFATNTSSLRLADIATVLAQPQRLVGIHFFNPVSYMPLVEVVKGKQSDKTTIAYAAAFVRQIKKLPLPVEDAPGFLVNQILGGYFVEAFKALAAGESIGVIDAAGRRLGMPMGPLELADQVGLDVCLDASEHLMGSDATAAQTLLREKVDKGELGRKTQKGFYRYSSGKLIREKITPDPEKLAKWERQLFLGMLNRALLCLDESVVNSVDLVDAGVIFGAGFPPFQGGILQYARTMDKQNLAKELAEYRNTDVQAVEATSAWKLLW
jgi:3-hydroxyacyl-CoA dehydrogenase/enoyl-CoA hydratase/3-hydroxybutyryl-CoA epimerase